LVLYSNSGATLIASLLDAGSTNITGILTDDFGFHTSAHVQARGSPATNSSASSSFTFDLQFYPLPTGTNQILGEFLNGNAMRFTYLGVAGANYALDRTFNLSPTNWIPQLTNTADADGVLLFTNTPVSTTNNFWRIRSVP
jgi:hypothetical protein